MSKKNQPVWKMLNQPEPPIVNGYWTYGQVYSAVQGPQRESLRATWDVVTWSWMHWGKKVRQDIEAARAEGVRMPLTTRIMDVVALTMFGTLSKLHRPKG